MTDRRDFLTAAGAALFGAHPMGDALSRWASHAGSIVPHRILGHSDGPVEAISGRDSLLEAQVLGTMQDAGLPQVGCYTPRCAVGRSLDPPRYVSSLALIEPVHERFFLVDATPDITRQIDLIDHPVFRTRASRRRPFDGIFLTHAHIGHYLGLALLGNEGLGITDTPVYCTPRMAEFLRTNAPWSLLVDQRRIVLTPLEPETAETTEPRWHEIDENFSVRLLKVPHRDEFADTVAFIFAGPSRSLLFLPDIDQWTKWDRDVAEVVRGVDIALIDGSFYSGDELPGRAIEDIPHPLIPSTMDLLQDVEDDGAARIIFTHLNNSNPALDEGGPQQQEITRRGFEVAREGMRIDL